MSDHPELLDELKRLAAGGIRRFLSSIETLDQAAEVLSGGKSFRALTPEEITALESRGCSAESWDWVRVAGEFDPEAYRNVSFLDRVWIAAARPAEDADILTGRVENARLARVFIGPETSILDVGLLQNVILEGKNVVFRCDRVEALPRHNFGLSRRIVFAPGTGGRELPVFPEVHSRYLAALAQLSLGDPVRAEYEALCTAYAEDCETSFTVFREKARANGVRHLLNSYLGEAARLEGAGEIDGCVFLSEDEAPTFVKDVVRLREISTGANCRIADGVTADNAHFCEASGAKEHARIHSSILAPNSSVTNGELSYSFLGPFTGFNHPALCIATFWPGGRGNIGYGANVGSNHSGKAADQENWAGEGIFYGLGCSVKFPCNTIRSPYSLIASGVTTLPQRIDFPFSLINSPGIIHPELSPAYNEIMPGWQIGNNLYGLLRNEQKYAKRNKARREVLETRVFREEIAGIVREALNRLIKFEGVEPAFEMTGGEKVFLPEQIPGLGKNYLRKSSLKLAIAQYTSFLEFTSAFEEEPPFDERPVSEKHRAIYLKVLELITSNRRRDDRRGTRVIPDYETVHGGADRDPLILHFRRKLEGK